MMLFYAMHVHKEGGNVKLIFSALIKYERRLQITSEENPSFDQKLSTFLATADYYFVQSS